MTEAPTNRASTSSHDSSSHPEKARDGHVSPGTDGLAKGAVSTTVAVNTVAQMDELARAEAERKLVRKMDFQIVPLCLMLYLLSFLDRTNIGQARLNGLLEDLNMSSRDYSIALTVLYVPYIIFEIPSNLVLKKFGPARWIPFLVMSWGLVSTLQGVVTSKTGLYINRAFLGLAEAGILPGIALYLTFFYKPNELNLRQALYFSGAALSGAFSGLLATAIGKMDGLSGLGGWSWIFILEGIFTVVFGVFCLWALPNDISKLWWLTPEERAMAAVRVAPPFTTATVHTDGSVEKDADRDANEANRATVVVDEEEHEVKGNFILQEVLRTFTDPLVLLFVASGYAFATLLYSVAVFSPTIIKAMDKYTTIESQLLSCPPNAAAFVVSVLVALVSDRYTWRYPAAIFCLCLSLSGTAVAYAAENPTTRYGGIILLSCGVYALAPVGISWMLNNTASHYKRATAIGFYIVFTNSGGITSTWLFNANEAPKYSRGFLVNLGLQAAAIVLVTLAELYIVWERKQRRQGKRDWRVTELKAKGWSDAKIKDYLGDRHPQFEFML